MDRLNKVQGLKSGRVVTRLCFFLDVCKHGVVVAVHVHPSAEQDFLKVAISLFLGQIDQLVQNFQRLRLFLVVY